MYTRIAILKGHTVCRQVGKIKMLLVLLSLILGISQSAKAVINTHEWTEHHRGYSIAFSSYNPQTGLDEYVAAGTIYDQSAQGLHGWHFMRIDANGHVLASRKSWMPNSGGTKISFRVVSIVRKNSGSYYIVIQVRDQAHGSENDYIYIAGVDQNGNNLSTNPTTIIKAKAGTDKFNNLYATHAYMNSYLYICGYAADVTEYPNEPTNTGSEKYGMLLTLDMTNTPASLQNSYVWNSANDANDFDMPLHIAQSAQADNSNPYIMVTGAANTENVYLSGALAAKFSFTGNPIIMKAIMVSDFDSQEGEQKKGIYGVDIRSTSLDPNPSLLFPNDYAILVNYFDEDNIDAKTWGIIRAKQNLSTYSGINQSYIGIGGQFSWANQFMGIHFDNPLTTWASVAGQQVDVYLDTPCMSSFPSTSQRPGYTNVNPFLTAVAVNGLNWNAITGFTTLLPGFCKPNYIQTSAVGTVTTTTPTLDYYNTGTTITGSALEDISRLYNFATETYYYTTASLPGKPPALIAPVGDDWSGRSNSFLKTKFVRTTTYFEETSCDLFFEDCTPKILSSTYNYGSQFSAITYQFDLFNTIQTLSNDFSTPTEIDCSSGYYKTTGVETVANDNTIKIFPNPTTGVLNISTNQTLSKDNQLHFILTDVTGKVVQELYATHAANNTVSVELPQIASGVYFAHVNINGNKHVEKIIVQ